MCSGCANISSALPTPAAVTRIALPYSAEELTAFLLALIRENGLRQDLHIRISAFVGEDDGRLDSTGSVGVMMAAMPMGATTRSRPMRGCMWA